MFTKGGGEAYMGFLGWGSDRIDGYIRCVYIYICI